MAAKITNNPTAVTTNRPAMAITGFVADAAAETCGADLYNSTLPPPPHPRTRGRNTHSALNNILSAQRGQTFFSQKNIPQRLDSPPNPAGIAINDTHHAYYTDKTAIQGKDATLCVAISAYHVDFTGLTDLTDITDKNLPATQHNARPATPPLFGYAAPNRDTVAKTRSYSRMNGLGRASRDGEAFYFDFSFAFSFSFATLLSLLYNSLSLFKRRAVMSRFIQKQGFTLIELMVVIVIIGVLASLAIPRFSEASAKAKVAEAPRVLASWESAFLTYVAETGDSVARGDQLIFNVPSSKWFSYDGASTLDTTGGNTTPTTVAGNYCQANAKSRMGAFEKNSYLKTTYKTSGAFEHTASDSTNVKKMVPNFFQ